MNDPAFVSHHFSAGWYAKEIRIPAGAVVQQHRHEYDHLSILQSGRVTVDAGGVETTYQGWAMLNLRAGIGHKIIAHTDSVWYCIHKTDETDPERIDAAVIVKG